MQISFNISSEEIKKLIIMALSDNVNQWIKEVRLSDHYVASMKANKSFTYSKDTFTKYEDLNYCLDLVLYEYPWECKKDIHTSKIPVYQLSFFNIETGLTILSDKYRDYFIEFIAKDYDRSTADVFLQCALFNEVYF